MNNISFIKYKPDQHGWGKNITRQIPHLFLDRINYQLISILARYYTYWIITKFIYLVLVSFSDLLWQFNGQVEDST